MLKQWNVILGLIGWIAVACLAAEPGNEYPRSLASFEDYEELMSEVKAHREERLVDFDTFLQMSKKKGVVILDARPAYRFDRIHVAGAKHLNFADFTQDALAKVIPTKETVVLIYCNNNFAQSPPDFPSKMVMPVPKLDLVAGGKVRTMALNIPTYLNLYGYGYRNVYELDELLDLGDTRVTFEGTEAQVPQFSRGFQRSG